MNNIQVQYSHPQSTSNYGNSHSIYIPLPSIHLSKEVVRSFSGITYIMKKVSHNSFLNSFYTVWSAPLS